MSKEYYLYVNGQRVKVSEQIYKVYWREKEHEKYLEQVDKNDYSRAAEPPVRCGESHLSGLTEPPSLSIF